MRIDRGFLAGTVKPVKLSPEDWIEIYHALEAEIHGIESGSRGYEVEANDDEEDLGRWADALRSIARRIGPDGQFAATLGVQGSMTSFADQTAGRTPPSLPN